MANKQRPCRACRCFIRLPDFTKTFCGETVPSGCGVCCREIELGLLAIRPKFRFGDNNVTNVCPDFMRTKKDEVMHHE